MLAVIGSVALGSHGYTFGRVPSDIDLVGDYDDLVYFLKSSDCKSIIPIAEGKKIVGRSQTMIYDCEITWTNSTAKELYELIISDPNTINTNGCAFASLNVCYMLKMTHRFRKNNPHFLKTMSDIHKMREWGAVIQPEHKAFFKKRLKETLSYKHPKLNQSKKSFFTDDVPYVY